MKENNFVFIESVQKDSTDQLQINSMNPAALITMDSSLFIQARQIEARQKEQKRLQESIRIARYKERLAQKRKVDTNNIPYLKVEPNSSQAKLFSEDYSIQFNTYKYDVQKSVKTERVFVESAQILKTEQEKTQKEYSKLIGGDWYMGAFILAVLLYIFVQLRYRKHLTRFALAIISYQASFNIFRNLNMVIQQIAFQLNLIFLICSGILLNQLAEYYNFTVVGLSQTQFIVAGFLVPLTYIIYKPVISKIVGFLSMEQKAFDEYNFNTMLYLKIFGLILLPVTLMISYLHSVNPEILFKATLIIAVIMGVMWFLRTILIFIRKGISIFFLILYLCALEILPLLVLVKFLYE